MVYARLLLILISFSLGFIEGNLQKDGELIANTRYQPTWDSLDKRPIPDWYDFSKLGIFIHWGVFSVPSFGVFPAWGWYYWKHSKRPDWVKFMKDNFRPDFTYANFARDFTAEFYNPDDWADLFKASGAKYMVLTAKHHEGFCNWPTNVSWNWNSADVGPKRDLVGDLAKSIRTRTDMHFGLYHSLYEFFNPMYLQDKANNYSTQQFVAEKTMPELYELVNTYRPDVIWSDGQWEASSAYWNSTEFVAWLYNDSPVKDTVVTNDRWGSDTVCKHGGYLTCTDQYIPGHLLKRKWENAMILNTKAWSWRRDTNIEEFLTAKQMIQRFVQTISLGGNMLMNVGPTEAGIINPILQERLKEMGSWLSVNGEAVYGSKPWRAQNDSINTNVWYTCQPNEAVYAQAKKTALELRSEVQVKSKSKISDLEKKYQNTTYPIFAFVLEWPETNILVLGEPSNGTEASRAILLGAQEPYLNLQWSSLGAKGIAIEMPAIPISLLPNFHAWAIGLYGFQ